MFAVGLTGGIASGKSTVSELFANWCVPIIDTDLISRKLLEPGELAYQQLCSHFGERILLTDGSIDRKSLREIVFNEAPAKTWLETMLHPLIYRQCHEEILANSAAKYVLVVIPLLFEANFQALVDRILVVDCPAELQLKRLLERDQIDKDLAQKMLAQQLSPAERVARAHDVIDNSGNGADLENQALKLHQHYLLLSGSRS